MRRLEVGEYRSVFGASGRLTLLVAVCATTWLFVDRARGAVSAAPHLTSPTQPAADPADTDPSSYLRLYVTPEAEGVAARSQAYVDLDRYYALPGEPDPEMLYSSMGEPWTWQVLPTGLIYRSYLAGTKEPRLSGQVINETDWGWLLDGNLGARIGLLRFGTSDPIWPDGFEIDAEGAAQVRLDIPNNVDVGSVDFRAGLPITFGVGSQRTKFGYYHVSAHLGDEYLLRYPGYPRLNYARDCLMFGHSVYLTPWWRLYGEADWAFYSDVCDPWEFQFGLDFAAPGPTGPLGAPFFAINGHLREELDFSGSLTVQTGWSWRNNAGQLFRMGLHYYNGLSNQLSFYQRHEQQIGFGAWYDF